MPKRMMIRALGLILLFGAFPLLTLLSAVLFASAFGCQLDEGSIHPCIVLGLDFGGLLYPMAVGGWHTAPLKREHPSCRSEAHPCIISRRPL